MCVSDKRPQLIILGTGSAFPRHSYNACFAIRCGGVTLLSDAGGGNGIFQQLNKAGIGIDEISHFIISHSHTDHILGAVWIVRRRIYNLINGVHLSRLHLFANRQTADALLEICRLTFLQSYFDKFNDVIDLHIIDTPKEINIATDSTIKFFDVCSRNVDQLGFRLSLSGNLTLVSLGDEALTEQNRESASDADYLICGAFCRYADRDVFRPYEKHHYTVKDVAITAEKAGVKNLILYHSEDVTTDRKKDYTEEANDYYNGNVIIPSDLYSIELSPDDFW